MEEWCRDQLLRLQRSTSSKQLNIDPFFSIQYFLFNTIHKNTTILQKNFFKQSSPFPKTKNPRSKTPQKMIIINQGKLLFFENKKQIKSRKNNKFPNNNQFEVTHVLQNYFFYFFNCFIPLLITLI